MPRIWKAEDKYCQTVFKPTSVGFFCAHFLRNWCHLGRRSRHKVLKRTTRTGKISWLVAESASFGWGVRGEGQILSDSMQSNWCLLVSEHVHCVHSCSLSSEQTFPLFYLCKSLIYIYIILIIIIIVHLFTHF